MATAAGLRPGRPEPARTASWARRALPSRPATWARWRPAVPGTPTAPQAAEWQPPVTGRSGSARRRAAGSCRRCGGRARSRSAGSRRGWRSNRGRWSCPSASPAPAASREPPSGCPPSVPGAPGRSRAPAPRRAPPARRLRRPGPCRRARRPLLRRRPRPRRTGAGPARESRATARSGPGHGTAGRSQSWTSAPSDQNSRREAARPAPAEHGGRAVGRVHPRQVQRPTTVPVPGRPAHPLCVPGARIVSVIHRPRRPRGRVRENLCCARTRSHEIRS